MLRATGVPEGCQAFLAVCRGGPTLCEPAERVAEAASRAHRGGGGRLGGQGGGGGSDKVGLRRYRPLSRLTLAG